VFVSFHAIPVSVWVDLGIRCSIFPPDTPYIKYIEEEFGSIRLVLINVG